MTLIKELVDSKEEMARWRHDIHKHPDGNMHDLRTASKVAELLRSFGFDEVLEQFGQAGVVGVLHHGKGSSVALAAGIGGQAVQEADYGLEYRSIEAGSMHAIGRDGETAMLLGVAKYLAKARNFSGTVVFIFCSLEDAGLGPQAMIEAGLFELYPVDFIYAMRSLPGLAIGKISLIPGAVTAEVAEILIKIEGVAGHTARPNQARNPIFVGAEIVNSLGNLVASEVDPGNPIVIGIASFNAGDSFSYIPATAELRGTVRFLNPDIESWLPEKIETFVNNIAESYGVKSYMSYRKVSSVGINDADAVHFAKEVAYQVLGENAMDEAYHPTMLGCGLANFFGQAPGAVIYLGNGNSSNLLSPKYNFNGEVLPVGASLLTSIVKAHLGAKK